MYLNELSHWEVLKSKTSNNHNLHVARCLTSWSIYYFSLKIFYHFYFISFFWLLNCNRKLDAIGFQVEQREFKLKFLTLYVVSTQKGTHSTHLFDFSELHFAVTVCWHSKSNILVCNEWQMKTEGCISCLISYSIHFRSVFLCTNGFLCTKNEPPLILLDHVVQHE